MATVFGCVSAAAARAFAAASLARIPAKYRSLETVEPYPVELSEELQLLVDQTRRSHAAALRRHDD